MPEPIVICDYDPEWPQRYQALRARLAEALDELAANIEHVGSTAVPGLAAKPTIDLNVQLRSARDLPAAVERLARLGYAHEGDFGIVGREAFATPPGYGVHDHHLYVCAPDWAGMKTKSLFETTCARMRMRLKLTLNSSDRWRLNIEMTARHTPMQRRRSSWMS
jgi:GrpB-like predicted nucleotidyltransferase (UPF0157 family)